MKDSPRAQSVWREVLTEKLEEHLPGIYEDPVRAQRLMLRAVFAETLRERQLAAGEIERLQPLGFELEEVVTEEEIDMGNWRDSLPSNYLSASDFEKPALLTIKGFSVEKVGDEMKPCVHFDGQPKGMILNITNGS